MVGLVRMVGCSGKDAVEQTCQEGTILHDVLGALVHLSHPYVSYILIERGQKGFKQTKVVSEIQIIFYIPLPSPDGEKSLDL